MTYRVEALMPSHKDLFVEYFKNLSFTHAPNWSSCFCRFYQTIGTIEEWQSRTAETNAAEARTEIEAGRMKGYLAFDGDQCIGWCNANRLDQFYRVVDFLRDDIECPEKTGAIFCYVIHPEYRGKGVARALLKAAIEGFEQEGLESVIAMPVAVSPENAEKRYRGTMNMYLENGFTVVSERDQVSLVRLLLK